MCSLKPQHLLFVALFAKLFDVLSTISSLVFADYTTFIVERDWQLRARHHSTALMQKEYESYKIPLCE
jgi:hypothetical protein